jgi:hypothetical protein
MLFLSRVSFGVAYGEIVGDFIKASELAGAGGAVRRCCILGVLPARAAAPAPASKRLLNKFFSLYLKEERRVARGGLIILFVSFSLCAWKERRVARGGIIALVSA